MKTIVLTEETYINTFQMNFIFKFFDAFSITEKQKLKNIQNIQMKLHAYKYSNILSN